MGIDLRAVLEALDVEDPGGLAGGALLSAAVVAGHANETEHRAGRQRLEPCLELAD